MALNFPNPRPVKLFKIVFNRPWVDGLFDEVNFFTEKHTFVSSFARIQKYLLKVILRLQRIHGQTIPYGTVHEPKSNKGRQLWDLDQCTASIEVNPSEKIRVSNFFHYFAFCTVTFLIMSRGDLVLMHVTLGQCNVERSFAVDSLLWSVTAHGAKDDPLSRIRPLIFGSETILNKNKNLSTWLFQM